MTNDAEEPALPAHIEDTMEALTRLRADHDAEATRLQRSVDRATAWAGRPRFVVGVSVLVVGWMLLNIGMAHVGVDPFDEPPFFWMQGAVALTALYMTLLVLATQRREDQLANRREQLTLQLSLLSERKAAKIIELIEELRRDLPMLHNRIDDEAAAMAVRVDTQAVVEALKSKLPSPNQPPPT